MNTASPASSREWSFGPIPTGWRSLPLKYLCSRSSLYGANVAAEVYENDGVRFLRTTDIQDDGTLNEGGVFVPADIVKDYILSEGDFLISRSGTVGRAYVYQPEDGLCAYAGYLVRYTLRDPDSPRWLFYITKSPGFQQWLGSAVIEATIGNVNGEKYANLLVPVPSLPQQRAIADYLDRETARLDALVAAKERVLALLAEKRQALIIRAVTRGLDPCVPLRDSGIPWLGQIPAHWETPPVYARFVVQLGKMLDEKRIRGGHLAPYLRNVDVQWGAINTADLPKMDFDEEDRRRYALRVGDILVCEGGEVGRCALWDDTYPECYYQKALHRLRPIGGEDEPAFFVLVMRAIVDSGQFALQSSASTIQHLPAEKLRIVRYPAPPIEEQRTIIAHVSLETDKLHALNVATERTIKLLKERRAALIAAAVTGQVDLGRAA